MATNDPRTQEIREAANRYLAAVGRRDWEAACQAFVPSERRYFDRLAGDCPKVFTTIPRGEHKIVRNSRAGEIRIGPHQATIEVNELGQRDVLFVLYAIEEKGEWGVARSKKRREAYPP